jgi:hypothetical protein
MATGRSAKVFMSLEDFPGKDIIPVCNKYFNLLSKMVKECETLFGIPVARLTRREELEVTFNKMESHSS